MAHAHSLEAKKPKTQTYLVLSPLSFISFPNFVLMAQQRVIWLGIGAGGAKHQYIFCIAGVPKP